MKNILFSGWSFFRILRLILGVIIVIQGLYSNDWQTSMIGLLFTGLSLFNIGCCGSNGCTTTTKVTQNTNKELIYEEVV